MTVESLAAAVGFCIIALIFVTILCFILVGEIDKIKEKERYKKQIAETRQIAREEIVDVLDYYGIEVKNNESER